MKGRLLVIMTVRSLIGWRQGLRGFPRSLAAMERDPYWRPYYHCYVLPLIHYICTEMNFGAEMNPSELLVDVNVWRCESEIKARAKLGIWSQDRMLDRMKHPPTHPEAIGSIDNHITKGVEYKFARLCSLVIPNFKVRWSIEHQDAIPLFITDDERNNLYRGYDANTPMRQPAPR